MASDHAHRRSRYAGKDVVFKDEIKRIDASLIPQEVQTEYL